MHRILKRQDLVRDLADGAPALGMVAAGMRGAPLRGHGEPAPPLSRCHSRDIGADRGLGDKHECRVTGKMLDQVMRCRAADLFVAVDQQGDGTRRHDAALGQHAHRVVAEICPGLHVVDAGTVDPVAIDPDRPFRERADIPDGIDMAHDERGRATLPRRVVAQHQMIAEAVAAGNALDVDRKPRDIVGRRAQQPADCTDMT